LVRLSEEDFARPVLPNVAAKRTLNRDGLEVKILKAGWDIAAALLARHHEGFAIPVGAS
jgi:hypothetical protein